MILLLHKDVYISDDVLKKANECLQLINDYTLSYHLLNHCTDGYLDRSHQYTLEDLNKSLKTGFNNYEDLFEIEVDVTNQQVDVTKICIRKKFADLITNQDLCLSIRPMNNSWSKVKLITAWLNSSKDSHTTLDKNKYCDKVNYYYYFNAL